jgi:hypothetical protein
MMDLFSSPPPGALASRAQNRSEPIGWLSRVRPGVVPHLLGAGRLWSSSWRDGRRSLPIGDVSYETADGGVLRFL